LTPRNKIPWATRSAKTYVILVAERHVAASRCDRAHFKDVCSALAGSAALSLVLDEIRGSPIVRCQT
jgi:hypothetical protein